MAIVAPDGAERGHSSRRRSYDDVVDDGPIAAEGRDRSSGSLKSCPGISQREIVKKSDRSELVQGTSSDHRH